MSRSKAKGTAAESMFVKYLVANGFPHAERRALTGGKDKGDTTGHPGLVFEVKDAKTWCVPAWLRETEAERVNANADLGFLIVKVSGMGLKSTGKWLGFVTPDAFSMFSQLQERPSLGTFYAKVRKTSFKEAIAEAGGEIPIGIYAGAKVPFAVMHVEHLFTLIRAAGYGTPMSQEGDI